ncbi:MAG: hypothetical protein COU90_02045 [Candidatus Ryanbacteria bacterium CG10_big_fil_rev_8_21_14_0_10_43_42]|uniref:Glycosyltransferase RgtA/B/C/D-like domain-containing protein n=1 Tax=Candidatus Ryanbacteria bacterium CG10_big_fil_rev_8_21_14_0_10_43_42 TaxID=1974864 RepID=A0A2M8KXE7_9BACT|nr:MAG: hypothetical protein COU90_02045 [Candidatus Ryanbacteria bacterium CG10_big_fil_rev_8_21_14_0_10_43_42]
MQKLFQSPLRLFIIILSLKILFVVGVVFFFGADRLLWGDAHLYIDIGNNIFSGNGFSSTSSDGTFYPNILRTPIYPAIIGFFSTFFTHGLIIVALVQAVIASAAAILIYLIGRFFLSPGFALLPALLFSFEPLLSVLHVLILPGTLHLFFILAFTYFFLCFLEGNKWQYIIFASVALGISVLVKPISVYLFVVPVGIMLFYKKAWKQSFIFLGLFFLLLSPWIVRYHAVTGSFGVSANDSNNICGWGLGGVLAMEHRIDSSNWAEIWGTENYSSVSARCTSNSEAVYLFLTEYPTAFIKTMALAAFSLLTNEGYTVLFEKPSDEQIKIHHNYLTPAVLTNTDWQQKVMAAWQEFSWAEKTIIIAGKIFWMVILIAAILGVFFLLKNRTTRMTGLLFFLMVGYFVGTIVVSTAFGVSARLRHPIDPYLLMLASYGIYYGAGREKSQNNSI